MKKNKYINILVFSGRDEVRRHLLIEKKNDGHIITAPILSDGQPDMGSLYIFKKEDTFIIPK